MDLHYGPKELAAIALAVFIVCTIAAARYGWGRRKRAAEAPPAAGSPPDRSDPA